MGARALLRVRQLPGKQRRQLVHRHPRTRQNPRTLHLGGGARHDIVSTRSLPLVSRSSGTSRTAVRYPARLAPVEERRLLFPDEG
jgi:hypothetical protein